MSAQVQQDLSFPWQPDSTFTAMLVKERLREWLTNALRLERGTHAETLLTAAGSLAGYAAQRAALVRGADVTRQNGHVPPHSILLIGTTAGESLLFGEWINVHLVPERGNQLPLCGFAMGAAMQGGVAQQDLPLLDEIARHVATTVGSPEFGVVRSSPGNTPHLQPHQAVKLLWSNAEKILCSPAGTAGLAHELPLKEVHWPIIASYVAAQLITLTKEVLSPRLAYTLVMESAIVASKLFPGNIEQGKWRFAFDKGDLAIHRNLT